MKPIVGTDRCMHAHAGFLARFGFGGDELLGPLADRARLLDPEAGLDRELVLSLGEDRLVVGPPALIRYNNLRAVTIQGNPGAGISSGQ